MPTITRYTLIDGDNERYEPNQPIESFSLGLRGNRIKWTRDAHHELPISHREMLDCEIVITHRDDAGDKNTVAGSLAARTALYGHFRYDIRGGCF